ncbi:hypothetical protein HK102_002625 [Quaeritorhiza haematococci]|nr:hypothetical protein HK102_002625 [Quaeritorhiza haematococci]
MDPTNRWSQGGANPGTFGPPDHPISHAERIKKIRQLTQQISDNIGTSSSSSASQTLMDGQRSQADQASNNTSPAQTQDNDPTTSANKSTESRRPPSSAPITPTVAAAAEPPTTTASNEPNKPNPNPEQETDPLLQRLRELSHGMESRSRQPHADRGAGRSGEVGDGQADAHYRDTLQRLFTRVEEIRRRSSARSGGGGVRSSADGSADGNTGGRETYQEEFEGFGRVRIARLGRNVDRSGEEERRVRFAPGARVETGSHGRLHAQGHGAELRRVEHGAGAGEDVRRRRGQGSVPGEIEEDDEESNDDLTSDSDNESDDKEDGQNVPPQQTSTKPPQPTKPPSDRPTDTDTVVSPFRFALLPKLFIPIFLFRCYNAMAVKTYFDPDEYWQSQEVAHEVVFGYGYLTWEWTYAIRGFAHPLVFATGYKLLEVAGLDDTELLVRKRGRGQFYANVFSVGSVPLGFPFCTSANVAHAFLSFHIRS